MKNRFYDALEQFGITYNSESGWLSEEIILSVYENHTHLPAQRIFILGEQFLILKEDGFRSVKFKHVKGFKVVKTDKVLQKTKKN